MVQKIINNTYFLNNTNISIIPLIFIPFIFCSCSKNDDEKISESIYSHVGDMLSSDTYDYDLPNETNVPPDIDIVEVRMSASTSPAVSASPIYKKLTSYEYDFFDSGSNNRIHLLSCTLSQIGRDCAISFANELGF